MVNHHTHSDASFVCFGALFDLAWLSGYFHREDHLRGLGHHLVYSPPLCDNAHMCMQCVQLLLSLTDGLLCGMINHIIFITDNTSVCSALNKGKSRNSCNSCNFRSGSITRRVKDTIHWTASRRCLQIRKYFKFIDAFSGLVYVGLYMHRPT